LALGRALARRGERPRALKALVPVDVRPAGAAGRLGNAISFAVVELPLGASDPIAVLRTVRDRTRAAKQSGAARPLDALARAGDLLPSAGRRAVARTAARLASFNAVVSNVPGPSERLTLMGRRLETIHPAVPLLEGHGLTVCGLSYAGRLEIGIYADAEVLPDAIDVARDMESAFDALRLAPARSAGGATPWQARARARREQAGAASRAGGD
jgi:diacylglycerol O-acyltransferase